MNELPPPLCTSIAGAPSWNYYLITAAPSSWNGRQDAPLPIGNQKCTLFQKYKHFEGSFFLDQDILSQILLCFHHLLQPSLLAKKSPPRNFFLKGEGEQDFFLNKKQDKKWQNTVFALLRDQLLVQITASYYFIYIENESFVYSFFFLESETKSCDQGQC